MLETSIRAIWQVLANLISLYFRSLINYIGIYDSFRYWCYCKVSRFAIYSFVLLLMMNHLSACLIIILYLIVACMFPINLGIGHPQSVLLAIWVAEIIAVTKGTIVESTMIFGNHLRGKVYNGDVKGLNYIVHCAFQLH